MLTSDALAAIRQQLAWAPGRLGAWATGRLGDWATGRLGDWATGLSAGAQGALVKKNQQRPEDAPQLRGLRLLVMRALNRSKLLLYTPAEQDSVVQFQPLLRRHPHLRLARRQTFCTK
ncbi:MAG: hypothetical protein Q7J36_16410 [Thiobacillus sp.]|nr:hypothetical protein [Thiobacillus sp.]